MYKKIIYGFIAILVLTSIFVFSYNFTSKIYLSKKSNPIGNLGKISANEDIAKQANSIISEDTLLPDNKVVYIVKNHKSNNILWQFEEKSDALVGKTKTQLQAKFGVWGYSVNFTSSQVTLEKDSIKYKPNKYVIGSDKDGYTVLYKVDMNGNLNIENKDRDIVYKKIQDMIDSGAYIDIVSSVISGTEFDSRDDAESCLGEIN